MKRASRIFLAATAFALLAAASASAQDGVRQSLSKSKQAQDVVASPDATQSCSYTFTSGSGISYLKFCVTANGNIVQFESPVNVEQISQPAVDGYEGYGICDLSTGNAYYDYAYEDSGNWGTATTVSQSSTSVEIARTTSDGLWTLTQTITSNSGTSPYAKVAMALKNNSGKTKSAYLLRFAGFVPWDFGSTGSLLENYDGTNESTFGYIAAATPGHSLYFGLMLQNIGNASPASALTSNVGFPQDTTGGPEPCKPTAQENSGTVVNNEGSGVYWYGLSLKASQTVTVTDRYLSF